MDKFGIQDLKKRDNETSSFKNVKFISGDALKPDTYVDEMRECDGVIHSVGSMIEGINYSSFIDKFKHLLTSGKYNPMEALFKFRKESDKSFDEESLEALNRDSTKEVASQFDKISGEKGKKGHFVFISAEMVDTTLLKRYL